MQTAYTLYLANRGNAAWDGPARAEACASIEAAFDSFTMAEATGFYRGEAAPTLVVTIATADDALLSETAARLRRQFAQESVGIVSRGVYERFTG